DICLLWQRIIEVIMKGPYQLFGELINNFVMCLLGIVCLAFGFYIVFTKNEKVKNKKRGVFLIIAGIIISIYHLVSVILYFVNK
ncbi:MAG: hypothetical protein II030_08025, partial [Treponema sp.]|nr:hypothetical protein [Treponema sp.]